MSTFPAILYDRSRVTTDWGCKRRRLYGYEWGGKGLAANEITLPLFTGTVLHDGLAAIAQGVPIDAIGDAAFKQMFTALADSYKGEGAGAADAELWAREQATLTEGMLRGFYRHCWPQLMEQFPTIVAVEQELIYEHKANDRVLTFMSKPDLLTRDRDGGLWYIEYKSTGSNKDTWTNSWSTAVQLHSAVRAVESAYGEKVSGVLVQGLYKGYCLAPGTQVLTNNLDYVNVDSLKVGDAIAGFEEAPQQLPNGKVRTRQWQTSTVTATGRAQLPAYRLTFEDGNQVVCSDQHQWLTAWRTDGSGVAQWTTTENLVPWANDFRKGHRVLKVAPSRCDTAWIGLEERGYLGGILDGEGHLSQTMTKSGYWLNHMAISQKPGAVLDKVVSQLTQAGIKHSILGKDTTDVQTVMMSDRRDILKLLMATNPVRLTNKFSFDKFGGMNNYERPLKLIAKEFLGLQEVVTLSTSTGTLVAEGLATHNTNYGKQTSPFCYAYYKQGNPPFTKDAWSYSYAAGYKKFPVWDMPGGIREWVANMPADQLAEQFPRVPDIFVNEDLVDAFFRQREAREVEIADAVRVMDRMSDVDIADTAGIQAVMDRVFPQTFEQCRPSFGKACQFNQLCHGAPGRDPLEHGFVYRQPHHQPEVDAWAEKEQTNG